MMLKISTDILWIMWIKKCIKTLDLLVPLKYNSCAIFADTRRWISYEDDVSA